ncbi:MAG: aromatic ring-hydroxylating dioxygenase subunit alpha [Beijerinckiaceae bacterium]|nr:aromatic ring-hydroxylating dioxygenase subunit alpha [Beijerinckiaceae bacterium]
MPFLRNAWYVAALSREVVDTPFARTLLDEPLVMFRKPDGAIAALQDRCPHRFVPLSRGRVCGAEIECGYHGLRFTAGGTCSANPHGDKTPPRNARVKSYPAVERYGFVWIWMGAAERADPASVPHYPFLEAPGEYAAVYGYLPVQANYLLVLDNLLDLSHVEFLHPLLSQAEGVDAHRTEFRTEGDCVIANRWKPNSLIHGLAKLLWTSPAPRGDARANMRWSAPAVLHFDLGVTEVGAEPQDGVCIPNAHIMTPATELTSHYFWAVARNRRLDDAELDERMFATVNRIFSTEDVPTIEAQQKAMGATADLLSLRPVMLEPDAPAIRARRILAQRIRDEQESAPGLRSA